MKKADENWLKEKFAGLAQFGQTDRGITRLPYTKEALAAENYIISLMEDTGLKVRRDALGNIFGRRAGKNDALAPVATGSHIDTVIEGGDYDGTAGVIGAIEAVRMLEGEELERPLDVIVFMAEELTSFGFANVASRLMTGGSFPKEFYSTDNAKGFFAALKRAGHSPEEYKSALLSKDSYCAFIEFHIEQGRVLFDAKEQLGVVKCIAGASRYKVTVEGRADHSGATPMGSRRDALVAAAKLVLAIQEIGLDHAADSIVATVGMLDVQPGAVCVIPGKVIFSVDIRGVEEESLSETRREFADAVREVAESDGVNITVDVLSIEHPTPMNGEIVEILDEAAAGEGVPYRKMNSGAGHDAMYMAGIVPTGMLFVPSYEGISHSPEEKTEIAEIALGVEVLAKALKRLASSTK